MITHCSRRRSSNGEGGDDNGDDDTDPCAAMDVTVVDPPAGQPPCGCVIGYAWDGTSCQPLENGVCSGSDCDELTVTLAECEAVASSGPLVPSLVGLGGRQRRRRRPCLAP